MSQQKASRIEPRKAAEILARYVTAFEALTRSPRNFPLKVWPPFASYHPESFDPSSWPDEVARNWQTLCLAVYAKCGLVYVPHDLLNVGPGEPRFIEASLSTEVEVIGPVSIVRGYKLAHTATHAITASMAADASAVIFSAVVGGTACPILVPVFDTDDVWSIRRASERRRSVGTLVAMRREGWTQPARVIWWDPRRVDGFGTLGDRAALTFGEEIATSLDSMLPRWFPAPAFANAEHRQPSG